MQLNLRQVEANAASFVSVIQFFRLKMGCNIAILNLASPT